MPGIAQDARHQSHSYRRNGDKVSGEQARFSIPAASFALFLNQLIRVLLRVSREQPFFLYKMSYLWYTWVGFLTAILIGLVVSWITGANKRKPGDENLYTPVIRGLLSIKVNAEQQVRVSDSVFLADTLSNRVHFVRFAGERGTRENANRSVTINYLFRSDARANPSHSQTEKKNGEMACVRTI